MNGWVDSDWYDRGGLVDGLYAVEAAGLRATDVLSQLKASADYITEHYRDGGAGTEGGAPQC